VNIRRFFPGTGAIIAFLVVMAVAVTGNIQTNDQILLPLQAKAIDAGVLSVSGHPPQANRGTLYFTFVREEQANLLTKLYHQYFDPDATILPNAAIYNTSTPSQQQVQQVQQQNVEAMLGSKTQATLAALNALGTTIQDEHVLVAQVSPTSKAVGKLHPNDVILAADGRDVHSSQQLIKVLQGVRPGTPVALLVSHQGAPDLRLTIPTIRNPMDGRAIIGIQPHNVTFRSDPRLPYRVTIDQGDVAGPSAGLMFALSIINRLSSTDLTHGYKIAGTGTIDNDGYVGPIGGVKQKVIGARQAGAKYFLVPAYCDANTCNYKEALPYAKGITLIKVNTLDDALTALRKLK